MDKKLKTASEMYQYCIDNGYGSGMNKNWGKKHFALIEQALMNDEYVQIAFIGIHNYISMTKHDGNFAYVITNKRIIMAQQKLFGENFQTISLDNVNDVTFSSGMTLGVLTIDTIKERFNVSLNKVSAKKISEAVHNVLDAMKKITKGDNEYSGTRSVTEEIKKYKELLDIGAITQEEFEAKKKQLLNL